MHTRWNLTGKKALVTGGTKGIGLAVVREFSALGCEVFFVARNGEEVEQLTNESGNCGLVSGTACDISLKEERARPVYARV